MKSTLLVIAWLAAVGTASAEIHLFWSATGINDPNRVYGTAETNFLPSFVAPTPFGLMEWGTYDFFLWGRFTEAPDLPAYTQIYQLDLKLEVFGGASVSENAAYRQRKSGAGPYQRWDNTEGILLDGLMTADTAAGIRFVYSDWETNNDLTIKYDSSTGYEDFLIGAARVTLPCGDPRVRVSLDTDAPGGGIAMREIDGEDIPDPVVLPADFHYLPPYSGGACCYPDGSCVLSIAGECGETGGVFQGVCVWCDPNPCVPQPTGACCFPDGHCNVTYALYCAEAGGTYLGDNTSCHPNPCRHGACCFPDGHCTVLPPALCTDSGGAYQGDNAPCAPDLCPETPRNGVIIGWAEGYSDPPAPNSGFVAVDGGEDHSLGLHADGSIVAWGGANPPPAPNTDFVAVAAGLGLSLGLKADGSIIVWGGLGEPPPPNTGFVAIAAHRLHALGLRAEGSVEAWGLNNYGQCNVPAPNTEFVAVSAGGYHSLGLKSDGSIVAWGNNYYGECDVPAPNSAFVAVAAGGGPCHDGGHSLGLKADGSIVAWGFNNEGQCNVPAPNSGFTAVAAGGLHSLGLKADGSVMAWGDCRCGRCDVPAPNADFVAIAAGAYHSLGLKWLGACCFGNGSCQELTAAACGNAGGVYQSDYTTCVPANPCPQPETQWTLRVTEGPTPRSGHTLAYDTAHAVTVLFGGSTGPYMYATDTTWQWDGNTWTFRTDEGPAARYTHAMAYDSARGVTVLFGGWRGYYLGDTWEWNGQVWTLRAETGPNARNGTAMTYDAARGVAVLFGGATYPTVWGDTWEWDGSAWALRSETGPTARFGHTLAYDAGRQVCVLFGGAPDWQGTVWGDTWEWDGATWTLRAVNGPPPRQSAALAYDAARGKTVLFGGYDSSGDFDDTWEWNGQVWTLLDIPGPSARRLLALAYDSARHRTVLFGGATPTTRFGDTWELVGGTPRLTPEPDQTCYQLGDEVTVDVWMRDVPESIVGGQFLLEYDPQLVLGSTQHPGPSAITPGDPPFTWQAYECSVQEQSNAYCTATVGLIDYAVGVEDPNASATGARKMAVLHFTAAAEICNADQLLRFRAAPPHETRLTTAGGTPYYPDSLVDLPAISLDSTPPVVTAPPDITVNADAGSCTATVDPGTATGVDNCGGPVTIVGTRSDGWPLSAPYPQGPTTITWSGTDTCGNVGSDTQTITVLPFNTAVVTLELQGPLHNTVVRCVTITFRDCAHGGGTATLDADVTFPANPGGNSIAIAVLTDVPCWPTGYDCATAEDGLHTLLARVTPTIAGSLYLASFTGPADMLYQADLFNDNVVDIVDFGVFIYEWGWYGDPNTPCGVTYPRSDMDASGAIDAQDRSFIATNFFQTGDGDCCAVPLSPPPPRTTISVAKLVPMGLGHLAVADLNNDGEVDLADIQAFDDGVRPNPKPRPNTADVDAGRDVGGGATE